MPSAASRNPKVQCDFTKLGRFRDVFIGLAVPRKYFRLFVVLRAPEHRETIYLWKVEDHNFHHVLIRRHFIKISKFLGPKIFGVSEKIENFRSRNFSFSYNFQWKIFDFFELEKISKIIFRIFFENFWDRKFSLKIVWKWKNRDRFFLKKIVFF